MSKGFRKAIKYFFIELFISLFISAVVILVAQNVVSYLPIWARILIFLLTAGTFIDPSFYRMVYITENN